jgi:hypothetical protein
VPLASEPATTRKKQKKQKKAQRRRPGSPVRRMADAVATSEEKTKTNKPRVKEKTTKRECVAACFVVGWRSRREGRPDHYLEGMDAAELKVKVKVKKLWRREVRRMDPFEASS